VAIGWLPKRLWRWVDPPVPMAAAAFPAALVTLAAGFTLGLNGFLAFAGRMASSQNSWMVSTLDRPNLQVNPYGVALVPYGTSIFTLFGFLFLTPLGLFSLYLMASSAVRAISAWFDDPRGDFLLSAITGAGMSAATTTRRRRRQAARENLEGPEAPDVLRPGSWCGLEVDYVVLAARRKAEWTEGAIILTSADWYRLGLPFDMDTPAGLRTAYPLKKLETVEVVRRGIEYELPRSGSQKIEGRR
jgi:hypothetical protein